MTQWLKEKQRIQRFTKNLENGASELRARGFNAKVHYYFSFFDGQYQLEVSPGSGKDGSGLSATLFVPDDFSSPCAAEANYSGTEYRPERAFGRPTKQVIDAFVRWVVEHDKKGAQAPPG